MRFSKFPTNTLALLVIFLFQVMGVAAESPLVFPPPQQLTLAEGTCTIDESTIILLPKIASDHDIFLARLLVAELSDHFFLPLTMAQKVTIPLDKSFVLMGTPANELVNRYLALNHLHDELATLSDEGYILKISAKAVVIAANTDQGAFYGFQSLRQLLSAKDKKVTLPQLFIKDRPRLPFRGIRMYIPGRDNIPFFKRFVRDFMAMHKFNKLIMEVNGVMRLDRHPEINVGSLEFAMEMNYSRRGRPAGLHGEFQNSAHHDAGDGQILEKAEVKELVDYVHQFHIEVIPEIPSLTHSYYLLNRHRELSEIQDAEWPDTYCPSNPASYNLIFDVYDEYLDVFRPKMIHLGKDEWRMPVDECPRCRGKDYRQLFVQDIQRIYQYLAAKGIKVGLWGDHLLESVRSQGYRERTTKSSYEYRIPGALMPEQVRQFIPKDILVFNWFWGDKNNDLALEQFGFKQAYGNFRPNISNWQERRSMPSVMGGAPSSWAATTEFNFGKDLLYDFLGCANLLWSENPLPQPQLIHMVRRLMPSIRRRLKGQRNPSEDGEKVMPIDISAYANAGEKEMTAINFAALRSGNIEIDGKEFTIIDPHNNRFAVLVQTDVEAEYERIDSIEIDEDVSSVIFLHACARPAANHKAYRLIYDFDDTADLLGWYEIVYEDGYLETVPIRYGVNILESNVDRADKMDNWAEGKTGSPQDFYCYEADAIDISRDMQTNPITFFAYEWKNNRFGKKLKFIKLRGAKNFRNYKNEKVAENAVILLALSVTEKRPVPEL